MPESFFDSTIVCNTGPLIGLSRAGLGHLIGPLFARVLLPEAVVAELRAMPSRSSRPSPTHTSSL